MQLTKSQEHYRVAFSRARKNGSRSAPGWLDQLRDSAMASFEKVGFPTTKDEDWRYTSVEPITSVAFERARRGTNALAADEVFSSSLIDNAAKRLVFVNGNAAPHLSLVSGVPNGVKVQSLAQALSEDNDMLHAYLARYAGYADQGFVALNTAFIEDGAFIFVPRGQMLEEPIYLVFVATDAGTAVVSHIRNLIVLEGNSQARIVETYIGAGRSTYFNNVVTEPIAQDEVSVDYYRLQRETDTGSHIGYVAANFGRGSSLTAHSITLGGSLVRNEVQTVLDGEGTECVLNGLYLLEGRQHVDNQTRIDHLKTHASSFELYKGILSGRSRAVFNGKIFVHKGAQKTDARQINRNLLLSDDAVVNTKPQLEIYADDVKCSHGSTIGQLDPDALFYLRSRGLDQENAQSLLSYGFAADVISRVKIPSMKARLDEYLLTKFGRN